jgi:hypothetical protein
MNRSYAVVWSDNGVERSGRLELLQNGFELFGRGRRLRILFSELIATAIGRNQDDRLHGLPVLALTLREGPPVRIASLEGAGALHELSARVEGYSGT